MVGCGDKESVEIVKETVSNVKLEGVSFRAGQRARRWLETHPKFRP
jgi:hypothetical protein